MPSESSPDAGAENLPDHLKLALTYAEESSKRARWTVFIIQIAAVLVFASVWLETDFDWLTLRLEAAQVAVRYLECEPAAQYPVSTGANKNAVDALRRETGTGVSEITREELDIAYKCVANPLTTKEEERARAYLRAWHFSLTEARKNVADLQQVMGNRVLAVGVPVLGIVFDINDLSIVAGITFSILLSWFYFNLRRQHKNTKRVFEMASDCQIKIHGKSMLENTYYLLRMSQVLTIPPGRDPDSRDVTRLRRLTRLPNVILWTAAAAQAAVLWEDLSTLKQANYLHPFVGRAETALAAYLFVYIFYRTVKCFQLTKISGVFWIEAWNRFCEEKYKVKLKQDLSVKLIPVSKHMRMLLGALLLGLAIATHMIDEFCPGVVIRFLAWLTSLMQGLEADLLGLWSVRHFLTIGMLVLIVAVLIVWRFKHENVSKARKLAWAFPCVALIDVAIHSLRTMGMEKSDFTNLDGFYSSPLLVIASLVFLFLLRKRPVDGADEPLED